MWFCQVGKEINTPLCYPNYIAAHYPVAIFERVKKIQTLLQSDHVIKATLKELGVVSWCIGKAIVRNHVVPLLWFEFAIWRYSPIVDLATVADCALSQFRGCEVALAYCHARVMNQSDGRRTSVISHVKVESVERTIRVRCV